MKKKLFIVELRDEINKRSWFIVRETTISKTLKEAGKICETNNFFLDRKSTRLNSSHSAKSRMPSSA